NHARQELAMVAEVDEWRLVHLQADSVRAVVALPLRHAELVVDTADLRLDLRQPPVGAQGVQGRLEQNLHLPEELPAPRVGFTEEECPALERDIASDVRVPVAEEDVAAAQDAGTA